MRRLLAYVAGVLLLVPIGTAWSAQVSVPSPGGRPGRIASGTAPLYYDLCGETVGGLRAKCDFEEWTTGAQWSFGNSALTIGAVENYSATVTTYVGGRQLFIAGARHYGTADIGKPLVIPGPNGTVWRGAITGWANVNSADQKVFLSTDAPFALSSASVTLVKDYIFNCSSSTTNGVTPSVGKTVEVQPSAGNDTGLNVSTVQSCTDANHVTTTTNATSWVSPTTILPVRIYTDDSAAANATVLAALSGQRAGDRYIYVSRSAGVPTMDEHATQIGFRCEREARLWKPLGNGTTQFRRFCVPVDAPPAAPPINTVPNVVFRQAGTAGPTVGVSWLGASTGTLGQSPIPAGSTFFAMTMHALQAQNPDLKLVPHDWSIGGMSVARYDTTASSNWPTWYSDHATAWLTYVFAAQDDILIYEISANEATTLDVGALINTHAKAASQSKAPDLVFALTDQKSLAAGCCAGNDFVDGGDYGSRFARGYASVYGLGVLDFRTQLVKLRDGFDPTKYLMHHAVPPSGVVNTPWALPTWSNAINDWAAEMKYAGTASQFCTAAGNEIRFALSGNTGGGVYSANVLRFGCDSAGTMPGSPGAGSTYYQVDIDANHPGAGAVALTPTQKDTWTISGATITAATLTPFLASQSGSVVTVPNAGGSGNPCVTTMTYVSSSSATLSPSCTAGTYTGQPLYWGNARVFTGYNFATDAASTFEIHFYVQDTKCGIVIQTRDDIFSPFSCVSFGAGVRPQIRTATNITDGSLTFTTENNSNAYRLYLGAPYLVTPGATDQDVLGGSPFVNGDQGTGWCGGSGDNHAGCRDFAMIYAPVLDAADLRIPARGIQRASPATGDSVQIANRTTWVNLTPSGTLSTLTLVMPAAPRGQDPVTVTTSQAVTTLTTTGASGQTVVGAPTSLSAASSVSFRYDATTKAWTRVQ